MSEVLLAVCTGRLTVVVRVHSLRKAAEDDEHPNHHAKELLSDTKMLQKHYFYNKPLICESLIIPFNLYHPNVPMWEHILCGALTTQHNVWQS